MKLYCPKCKRVTETCDESMRVSKNNKVMWQGTCVVCRTSQSQFVKIRKEDGVFESRSTPAVP